MLKTEAKFDIRILKAMFGHKKHGSASTISEMGKSNPLYSFRNWIKSNGSNSSKRSRGSAGGSILQKTKEITRNEDGELSALRSRHASEKHLRHPVVAQDPDEGTQYWTTAGAADKEYTNPVKLQINAENIPNSCFKITNAYFDLQLVTNDYIDYLDKLILQFQIQNSHPTQDMHLGPFYQLWDKIEFLPNGSNVQETLYPEPHYFMTFQNLPDEERANLAQNYGYNRQTDRNVALNPYQLRDYDAANAGVGIVLAPGQTYTYFCEIPWILKYMNLYLPALGSKMWPRFRFYPSKDNCLMSTDPSFTPPNTANPPTILQAIFIVCGPQLAPTIRQDLQAAYADKPTIVSGIGYDRQIINYNPVNGVESADLVLNSITGQIAALMVILRPVGVANEALFSPATGQTWREISNFTFKAGGGKVISYEKQPMQLYRSTEWRKYFNSSLALEKAVFFYPFCEDIMKAIEEGANTGTFMMNGKDTLRITPISVPVFNAFVDSDPHELLVYVYRYSLITLHNGVLDLRKL